MTADRPRNRKRDTLAALCIAACLTITLGCGDGTDDGCPNEADFDPSMGPMNVNC